MNNFEVRIQGNLYYIFSRLITYYFLLFLIICSLKDTIRVTFFSFRIIEPGLKLCLFGFRFIEIRIFSFLVSLCRLGTAARPLGQQTFSKQFFWELFSDQCLWTTNRAKAKPFLFGIIAQDYEKQFVDIMNRGKNFSSQQKVNDARAIEEMKAWMQAQMENLESVQAQMANLESMVTKRKIVASDVEFGGKRKTKLIDDDDVKQSLFEGSTHRFLFLDTIKGTDGGGEYKVGRWNKFVALAVIALQLYSYTQILFLISDFVDCNKDSAPSRQNASDRLPISIAPSMSPESEDENGMFVCEFESLIDFAKKSFYIPGFLLLLCFLSQDLFEGVVLFQCRGCMTRVTALLIFLEAVFAIVTAFMGTFLGFTNGQLGVLDSFLLIVGIIFVHDVDEQIGYWKNVQRRLGEKFPYSEAIVWSLYLLLAGFIIAGIFIAMS